MPDPRFVVAVAPIAVLLCCILFLGWRAPRAAALAWLLAVAGAYAAYGARAELIASACAKGLSLALLVMLIVWAAVFLYNLALDLGAVSVIAGALVGSTGDKLLLGLLLAWGFSGFMQGIAGFGVPVAVVAPLLLLAGYSPVSSVAMVMIGHSWAITFGSMGSSFIALGLVTGIDAADLGPPLALMFAVPIVCTGLSVAHIAGGWSGTGRAAPLVLVTSLLMGLVMWGLNEVGAAPISSMLPGLLGSLILFYAGRGARRAPPASGSRDLKRDDMSFAWAFLPYALLVILSLGAQAPLLKEAADPLRFALAFPEQRTSLGFVAAGQEAYAPIRLVGHPAPLLLLSALLSYLAYRSRGVWRTGAAQRAWVVTVRQTTGTTVGVSLMVMMAIVIADSGMAERLARGVALLGSIAYVLAAPFIGLIGAFITGSNTNSNVLFGPLQLFSAGALALSPLLVAAAQTMGGAIGSGVAPDKALIGVSVVEGKVSEGEVMRRVLPYGLLCVLLIGIEVLIISALGAP